MCGIIGLISRRPEVLARVFSLADRLQHRGPDDAGFLFYAPGEVPLLVDSAEDPRLADWLARRAAPALALGHRRLSILDLSSKGRQPMASPDGRHFLAHNGEVYNFEALRRHYQAGGRPFFSGTDTEAILAALEQKGEGALNDLVGMFALAHLDTRRERLLLVRDHFGIKPLHYAEFDSGLAFASEIAPLLTLPGLDRALNPQRLFDYVALGASDFGGQSLLAGVRQLPAAHFMGIDLKDPRFVPATAYWSPMTAEPLDISRQEAARRVREAFLHSVELHLRSDVRVGAAISGGIDSSAIVFAIRHLHPAAELHTFGYMATDEPLTGVAGERSISERRWIELAAKESGAILHPITAEPHSLEEEIDALVRTQGEPFSSPTMMVQNHIFRTARAAGVTVMLNGQGADELLGGYMCYQGARLGQLIRGGHLGEAWRFLHGDGREPNWTRKRLLRSALRCLLPDVLPDRFWYRSAKQGIPMGLNQAWLRERGVDPRPFTSRHPLPPRGHMQKELFTALTQSSLPALLRYEDRNSMAHSVESRVPFLTPALCHLLYSLPDHHLVDERGLTKRVFRDAMAGIVPEAILARRDKIGFDTPTFAWAKALQPLFEGTFSHDVVKKAPCLDLAAINDRWQEVMAGRRPFDLRLWRWFNVCRWLMSLEETGGVA